MKLSEAKTYNPCYAIAEVYCGHSSFVIHVCGCLIHTYLGYTDEGNILVFKRKSDADEWIKKHSYKGMSSQYIVTKLINNKSTKYKWLVA